VGSNSCGCSTNRAGATASVLLGIPGPRQADAGDDARDGLPALTNAVISSRVYRNAEHLPAPRAFTDRPQFETNIQLLDLGDGAWCLNHAGMGVFIYGISQDHVHVPVLLAGLAVFGIGTGCSMIPVAWTAVHTPDP
jgi:hypothetical protein